MKLMELNERAAGGYYKNHGMQDETDIKLRMSQFTETASESREIYAWDNSIELHPNCRPNLQI